MKLLKLFIIILLTISFSNISHGSMDDTEVANCGYNPTLSIGENFRNCKPDNMVGVPDGATNMALEDGGKKVINKFIKNMMIFLGLMTILAIVYAGFSMVTSVGDDEKIKKAKDIVKWAILGFLAMIIAGGLVGLIVNFIYSL